jgi:hypothetical protein
VRVSANKLKGRALTVFNEMRAAGVAEGVALQEVRRMRLDGVPAEELTEAQTAARDALPKPSRAVYESWREVGHSHVQALEEVRVAGVAEPLDEAAYDRMAAGVFGRPVSEATTKAQGPTDLQQLSAKAFGRAVK